MPQTVRHFSRDQLPLAVGLVLDASGSIAPYVAELRQAARETLRQLKTGDQAALFQFSGSLERVVELTPNIQQVAERIQGLQTGGGTNIFDALAEVLEYLRLAAPERRRVVLLISDNVPTIPPRITERELIQSALRAETAIYSIKTPGRNLPLPAGANPFGSVERIVPETGGEVIDMDRVRSVAAALAAVVERLKTRYTLGYYATNKALDGTFRVIQVELGDHFGTPLVDYLLYARRGYYAPREAAP